MPSFFRRGLVRIAYLLAAYTLCRILFLWWNWDLYSSLSVREWLPAFVHGLRFDLSALVLTNSVLMLLWLFPARVFRGPWLARAELAVFFVINWICIGANIVDAEFVQFIGKRSSYDILLIQGDLQRQGLSVVATYWYFCLALTLLVAFLTWLGPSMQGVEEPPTWFGKIGWRLLAVALLVTAVRGGYQFKPLHPMHAYYSTRHELGLLTLNTPFNVLRSRARGQIERQRFFNTDKEAITKARELTQLSRPPLALAKDFNVVVIIVESLGTEYLGAANDHQGYTPFLDSLAKESYFFKYNFANARRSIEALPAVVCGVPAIMSEPVITSDFASNRFDCLPNILNRRGYATHFLHGAHNGSMHFDTFSRIAGFKNFVGLNEFPKDNPEDFDKYWGVLDEPMLQHAAKVLDEATQPSLVSVFTLSSHHPYYIPPKYKDKFPKGTLEIHESIGYADHALREFFATARTKPWFNKTIFVITGDHTQKVHHKDYLNLKWTYRVPLFVYVPGLKDKLQAPSSERITQHIDIMPSVLDLLGVEEPDRLLVGQSIFDQGNMGRAYNFSTSLYWYIDPQMHFQMDRTGNIMLLEKHHGGLKLNEEPVDPGAVDKALLSLKGLVHYLNEGLVRNNLYGWRQAQ